MSEQDGIEKVAETTGTVSPLLSLGQEFARAREARKWTPEFVSERLKFGARQIRALEAESWAELPTGTPLRGLVRNYARLLEIDPEPLLRTLGPPRQSSDLDSLEQISSLAGPQSAPATSAWPSSQPKRRPAPWIMVLIMAVAAIAVLGYALHKQGKLALGGGQAARVEAAKPAEEQAALPASGDIVPSDAQGAAPAPETPAPAAAAPVAPPAAAAPQAAPASAPADAPPPAAAQAAPSTSGGIVLAVNQDCWVEIRRADGSVALSRILAATETYQLDPAGAPYKVVLGNAKGVDLNWRGNRVDLASKTTDNVARLTLE